MGNPPPVSSCAPVVTGKTSNDMKVAGEKCGWVIPRKERRVLKLLRAHKRECDLEFVEKSPSLARRRSISRMQVEFAREDLTAFQPLVELLDH